MSDPLPQQNVSPSGGPSQSCSAGPANTISITYRVPPINSNSPRPETPTSSGLQTAGQISPEEVLSTSSDRTPLPSVRPPSYTRRPVPRQLPGRGTQPSSGSSQQRPSRPSLTSRVAMRPYSRPISNRETPVRVHYNVRYYGRNYPSTTALQISRAQKLENFQTRQLIVPGETTLRGKF